MHFARRKIEGKKYEIKQIVSACRIFLDDGIRIRIRLFPEFCHDYFVPLGFFLRTISLAIFICKVYTSINPADALTLYAYPSSTLNDACFIAYGEESATTFTPPLKSSSVTSPSTRVFTSSLNACIASITGSNHFAP